MRLWHEKLISKLPRLQLIGQHRECCALRGNGWGKKHKIVNYVFDNSYLKLFDYHELIMAEMKNRGYKVDEKWTKVEYRGKICNSLDINNLDDLNFIFDKHKEINIYVYEEHNDEYLQECLDNLKSKNIFLEV